MVLLRCLPLTTGTTLLTVVQFTIVVGKLLQGGETLFLGPRVWVKNINAKYQNDILKYHSFCDNSISMSIDIWKFVDIKLIYEKSINIDIKIDWPFCIDIRSCSRHRQQYHTSYSTVM
jgi:hypothetical protein